MYIEENFEYVIAQLVKEFKRRHPEFSDLNAEEIQDELWKNDNAIEFSHMLMEKCEEFNIEAIFG